MFVSLPHSCQDKRFAPSSRNRWKGLYVREHEIGSDNKIHKGHSRDGHGSSRSHHSGGNAFVGPHRIDNMRGSPRRPANESARIAAKQGIRSTAYSRTIIPISATCAGATAIAAVALAIKQALGG